MKLIDVLELMERDYFPPVMEKKNGRLDGIDSRPQSVFNVNICFMCEEETWLKCNVQNEILIPWYDCEVSSINPEDEYTISIWLKDNEYLISNFNHLITIEEQENKE